MFFTYILRSVNFPDRIYIGQTQDIEDRIALHNAGRSTYTNKYKPWELIFYGAFPNKQNAILFEKFLKSGSGRAFIKSKLI